MARKRYDIAGRTVLITGAARGIGAETATRLHARGANVALVGLEPDLLEAHAAGLGERAAWFEADVSDADALERAVQATLSRFGALDVAIANAGIHYIGALATAPVEQVERVLNVNLMGVWRTDRAVLPHIAERKGYLLNIASLAAASHAPLMAPYAASKAAVEALTDSLRVEMAPAGVGVGCAYFGFIDTDLVRGSFAHPSTQVMSSMMPAGLRRAVPVSVAVDSIERGIECRAARVWAPRYVGSALRMRGVLQPLLERRAMRSRKLAQAIRLADPSSGTLDAQDELLGVAVTKQPVG